MLSVFSISCDGLPPEVISVIVMPQYGSGSRCKKQKNIIIRIIIFLILIILTIIKGYFAA